MDALDVLPVDDAKLYLNWDAASSLSDEAELTEFIRGAVERVNRHLGRRLEEAVTVTALERLAVKVVLAEFWETQRNRTYGGGAGYGSGGASGTAIERDSGPGGAAPLRIRLAELLGDPVDESGAGSGPQGSFPAPASWPDPAERYVRW